MAPLVGVHDPPLQKGSYDNDGRTPYSSMGAFLDRGSMAPPAIHQSWFPCFYLLLQVFQWLEQPNELEQAALLQGRVVARRQELFQMWLERDADEGSDNATLVDRLRVYEAAVAEAVANKVPLEEGLVPTQWTYTQSVFFASTVLTTIGSSVTNSSLE